MDFFQSRYSPKANIFTPNIFTLLANSTLAQFLNGNIKKRDNAHESSMTKMNIGNKSVYAKGFA